MLSTNGAWFIRGGHHIIQLIQSKELIKTQQFGELVFSLQRKIETSSTNFMGFVWGEKKVTYKLSDAFVFMLQNRAKQACKWWMCTADSSSMRHNLLSWKVLKRAILAKEKLASMGTNMNVFCTLFGVLPENAEHIFLECSTTRLVWTKQMIKLHRTGPSHVNLTKWECIHAKIGGKQKQEGIFTVVLKSFIIAVWRDRNTRIFDANRAKTDALLKPWKVHEIRCTLDMLFTYDPGIYTRYNLS
jgi:hypothetical protein